MSISLTKPRYFRIFAIIFSIKALEPIFAQGCILVTYLMDSKQNLNLFNFYSWTLICLCLYRFKHNNRPGLTKLVLILYFFNIRRKLCVIRCYKYKYNRDPVLIQRILLGFEAILENKYLIPRPIPTPSGETKANVHRYRKQKVV